MTVSRVLNHPQLVTPELKELVYQAMNELDYRPNTIAKALAKNRTLVVKVLILEEMDVTEPYYMHLINGIAKGLDHYHYALQLITENSVDFGESDGYIVTGMKEDDYEWVKKIDKPVIVFGENRYHMPFVDSNNRLGTETATRYAIERGYQDIIFVGIDVPELFEESREIGYKSVMEQYPDKSVQIHRIRNSSSQAANLVKSLSLKENTCFICASDRIAIGIERGLQTMGKSIPEDFGIIGFDGVFLDQIAAPMLTTMKQQVVAMGSACVDQLMLLIDGKELEEEACYFYAKLLVRGTTK